MDDAVFIGGPEKRDVVIEDYDPAWTARFEQASAALREALPAARRIEHFGSTAVPGLGAKGIIDVPVTVDDADDEAAYAPREVARREWDATNDYSTAKGAVVAEIMGRARRWAGWLWPPTGWVGPGA